MPQNPNSEAPEPLLEVLDDVAPAPLHAAAWATCSGKKWYFGHGSNDRDFSRFWKMDLEGDSAFNALWEHVRPRCEALAGASLRVVRQYANGHTYGLGGNPHWDDKRPGTFTFLYYPNPEWKGDWDGETVFYDPSGEIALSVVPRPNRAVFFDSRILHAGRAPSRLCPALRVTVAYKLEAVGSLSAPLPQSPPDHAAEAPATELPAYNSETHEGSLAGETVNVAEISRDGAQRVYKILVQSDFVGRAVQRRLEELAKSVRLPGFRAGRIPDAVMEQRYGAQARSDVLNGLAAETADRFLKKGSVTSALDLKSGAHSGDLEFHFRVTYFPDLPSVDFSDQTFERLTATSSQLQSAGITADEAGILLRNHLKSQVLDRLDATYRVPLLPALIEREFSALWKAAESDNIEIPAEPAGKAELTAKFRAIAERRLRLGLVVAEMARRFEIRSKQGAELEDQVIDHLVAQAQVEERQAGAEDLSALMDN
jgi:hypothetical protein